MSYSFYRFALALLLNAWYGMAWKIEWSGTEISEWNMEDARMDGMENFSNGMKNFRNGMKENLPYFHTNSILDFAHGIY